MWIFASHITKFPKTGDYGNYELPKLVKFRGREREGEGGRVCVRVRARLSQLTYLLKLKLFVHRYFDLSLLHLGHILVEKLCVVL